MYLFTGKIKTVKITIVIVGYFIVEYENILILNIFLGITKINNKI